MENLYNYVFVYNSYQKLWYAILKTDYAAFSTHSKVRKDRDLEYHTAEDINDLIKILKK